MADRQTTLNSTIQPHETEQTPLLAHQTIPENDQHSTEALLPISGKDSTVTWYALLLGLSLGTLNCCMNTYLGLQTGGVNGLPLPTTFLAWSIPATRLGSVSLTTKQTVFVVTVATSVSTVAMTAGLLGVIPALQYRIEKAEQVQLSLGSLLFWSLSLCFFAPLLTMLSREWFLVKRSLTFPHSIALAQTIRTLEGSSSSNFDAPVMSPGPEGQRPLLGQESDGSRETTETITTERVRYFWLVVSCCASAIWTVISMALGRIRKVKNQQFQALTCLSTALIGTGMVTGFKIALDAVFGAALGFILLPIVHGQRIGISSNDKAEEERLWYALTALFAECSVDLVRALAKPSCWPNRNLSCFSIPAPPTGAGSPVAMGIPDSSLVGHEQERNEDLSPSQLTYNRLLASSLAGALFCIVAVNLTAGRVISWWVSPAAIVLAVPVGYLAVQTEGVTGHEPISGLAKLSQVVFGGLVPGSQPHALVTNLVAGAIAEAGAEHAGGLMYQLKAAQLLKACPGWILCGHLIGKVWGAVVSVLGYKLLTSVWPPGSEGGLDIPATRMWLAAGRTAIALRWPGLAAIAPFVMTAITFVLFASLRGPNPVKWRYWLPSGSAFAMGLYTTPEVTIARLIGGVAQYVWLRQWKRDPISVQLIGSSLMLGNGLATAIIVIPLKLWLGS